MLELSLHLLEFILHLDEPTRGRFLGHTMHALRSQNQFSSITRCFGHFGKNIGIAPPPVKFWMPLCNGLNLEIRPPSSAFYHCVNQPLVKCDRIREYTTCRRRYRPDRCREHRDSRRTRRCSRHIRWKSSQSRTCSCSSPRGRDTCRGCCTGSTDIRRCRPHTSHLAF